MLRLLARYEKRGGCGEGGGVLSVEFCPDTKSGGGGRWYDRVSGGPVHACGYQ